MWINRETIHDVAMLEPQDVAPKNAFYRVARTHGSPQILVMESDGTHLHTHAYTHLLSDEDRRNCPPQNKYLLKEGQQTFDGSGVARGRGHAHGRWPAASEEGRAP